MDGRSPRARRLRTASDDFSQSHGRCGLGASPVTDADLHRVEGSAPNERSELLVAPRHWGVHPRRMLAATPRVVVWGVLHNASLVRSSSYGRIDRVVSCRNANCCARVKGAGRAHAETPTRWLTTAPTARALIRHRMDDGAVAGRRVCRGQSAQTGISCDFGKRT